jgi:hypothetical protein
VARIGIDLDGVMAQFVPAYRQTLRQYQPDAPESPSNDPTEWHFEGNEGFTSDTVRRAWDYILKFPTWWGFLAPYPDARIFVRTLQHYVRVAPIFITTRPRDTDNYVQRITERWVLRHLGVSWPVIVTDDKGRTARETGIVALLDDRPENLADLPDGCHRLLLARGWNVKHDVPNVVRVLTLADALDYLEGRKA